MSAGNSVYSPLPQSNSDSDKFSEEELHSPSETLRVINYIPKHQKRMKTEVSSGKKQRVTNYKQLDDRDIGIALNGFQLGSEEISVLKPNNRIEKFSTSRKVCFAFSIFLCISTTIIFLWILPCEIGSCPSVQNLPITNSWKKLLSGIELHGPISVVPSFRGGSQNLMFLYRDSFKDGNETQNTHQGGGVISLLGNNGKVFWRTVLDREPKDVDCNIIDIDGDGWNECLIVGRKNLLQAIRASPRGQIWNVHGTREFDSKSCDFSFPVALPDINGDGVNDLLTICSDTGRRRELASGPKHSFILISGLTGTVFGDPAQISNCYSIRNFMLEKENLISYSCLDPENQESVKTIPLLEIIMRGGSLISKNVYINRINLKKQHRTRDDENIFYIQGRRLNLENQGKCPEDCNMLVTVKDERNERKNNTLWTMKSNRSYGMIPVIMKFAKFNGFVLKYWHWEPNKGREVHRDTWLGSSSVLNKNMKMKDKIRRLENSKSLELELLEGSQQESARRKRMLKKRQSEGVKQMEGSIFKEENHIFHKIIEKVVLIVFNETDSYSVNASQSEITQICKKGGECQPNVLFQRHSLHITDLDGDNFQELISYSSSFVNPTESKSMAKQSRWQLESTVRVIRLEAELPKLYDGKNQ